MLIQMMGGGSGAHPLSTCGEREGVAGGLWHAGQFHGMGCAIHRNELASHRRSGWRCPVHTGKSERQLLLFADAVRPNTQRRFVLVLASR